MSKVSSRLVHVTPSGCTRAESLLSESKLRSARIPSGPSAALREKRTE